MVDGYSHGKKALGVMYGGGWHLWFPELWNEGDGSDIDGSAEFLIFAEQVRLCHCVIWHQCVHGLKGSKRCMYVQCVVWTDVTTAQLDAWCVRNCKADAESKRGASVLLWKCLLWNKWEHLLSYMWNIVIAVMDSGEWLRGRQITTISCPKCMWSEM